MCILACFTWSLTVSKEVNAAADMILGALRIEKGRSTSLEEEDDEYSFASMTKLRVYVFSIVQCLRMTLAGWLLWYGTEFLVYTTSLTELMLNAVALEFIMTIDELLFSSIMPYRVRTLVEHVSALEVSLPVWQGFDVRNTFTCIAAFSLMIYNATQQVTPQMSTPTPSEVTADEHAHPQ